MLPLKKSSWQGQVGAAVMFLAAALVAATVGTSGRPGQEPQAGTPSPLRTFFSVRSAVPDPSLPETLRTQFEKTNEEPLRSVTLDLNLDGVPEKFVLNPLAAIATGYQWLVYDQKTGSVLGLITGTLIFVHREAEGRYPKLETYWKQGGEMAVVFEYVFDRVRYERASSRSLSQAEISAYFSAKPPLDQELELVEIKTGDPVR
jgi:hypothetical protein